MKKGQFETIIPRRRLDIEENVNDIAEEVGRLYGYHNLKSTLPLLPTIPGKYEHSIQVRKDISKRMRSLGLNETRTYSLVDQKNADMFYKDRQLVLIPNPMSSDRSALRKTMIPSMLDVIKYNKSRGLKDISIYEISKVFFDDFQEENHLAVALTGNYISNKWQGINIKSDFYVLKGIVEKLLDYKGLKNRYSFVISTEESLHPGISADILVDRKKVGFLGRIHPKINKDDIYVMEISLAGIDITTKPLKFKQSSKLPSIKKDMAFIVNNDVAAETLLTQIRKSGGRLLTDIEIFDIYTGENVGDNEKSIAFSLTFSDPTRTLSDEEVTTVFEKIISDVESKVGAKLRNK